VVFNERLEKASERREKHRPKVCKCGGIHAVKGFFLIEFTTEF
jgi:hypothetical protein